MRVISQDGTLDIPYEDVIIQRFESRIYFLNKNLTGVEPLNDDMQIAEYSTEEKAKKAMEMLRKSYVGSIVIFQNVHFVSNKIVIILFIIDLSLSVRSSYFSILSGVLTNVLNNFPEEQLAILQIFIALSILIPVLPVSICDKNCAFIFSSSANSSCVKLRLLLISLTF